MATEDYHSVILFGCIKRLKFYYGISLLVALRGGIAKFLGYLISFQKLPQH